MTLGTVTEARPRTGENRATGAAGLVDRLGSIVERRTSRRGFIGRSAIVGSALVISTDYVLRPGTAYAAVCSCPRQAASGQRRSCDCGDLCCDGYTEFCCQLYGTNSCPPDTVLAGWWKVDNSDYCQGAARYYMDCNKASPACGCNSRGVCKDPGVTCQCRSCGNRADGCTVFRYGNCNNDLACVGPIVCRVVTCTEPWAIEPTCTQVARTDPATANHHRDCLIEPVSIGPIERDRAWAKAVHADYLGRPPSDSELSFLAANANAGFDRIGLSVAFSQSDAYIQDYLDDVYQQVLGRSVDSLGRSHWTETIRAGANPSAVAVEVYASDEHFRRSGSIDGYLASLYDKILSRQPDAAGRAYWAEYLTRTGDRRTVSASFWASLESRRRRVTSLYDRFLGRQPDSSGLDYWIGVLASGDDLALATFLSGSDEYVARAQRRFPT